MKREGVNRQRRGVKERRNELEGGEVALKGYGAALEGDKEVLNERSREIEKELTMIENP